MKSLAVLTLLLFLSPLYSSALVVEQDKPGNVIVAEAATDRCQAGTHQVAFAMPEGWTSDKTSAAQIGACAVLVPRGSTMQTTQKVILILFQQRDPGNRDFADLKAYAKANLNAMKSRFKDVSIDERQLAGRDTKRTPYLAYEVYGKTGPSPSLYMFVDASDGFYTVSATVLTRDELTSLGMSKFFSLLAVL